MNEVLFNKARGLFEAGDYLAAAENLRAFLQQTPNHAEARLMQGIACVQLGRPKLAEANLLATLQLEPKSCDALVWLAQLRRLTGLPSEAAELCRKAIVIDERSPAAFNILGLCCLETKKGSEAVKAFERLVSLTPSAAEPWTNLGLSLRLASRSEEATAAFRRAMELAPDAEINYIELSEQLRNDSAWQEAIDVLRVGLQRIPRSIAIALLLAKTFAHVRDFANADRVYKLAAELDPAAKVSYGSWLQQQGRFAESEAWLRRAIEQDPRQGQAYLALAEASLLSVEEREVIEQATQAQKDPALGKLNCIYLSYALGKANDQAGRFEEAARYFREANDAAYALHNGGMGFDPAITKGYPDKIAKIYSRKILATHRHLGSDSEAPILIVGMIRSGTTLLDQIVSSHSCVGAAGELPFWKQTGDKFNRHWYDVGIAEDVWQEIQDGYLAVLSRESGGALRVTDKMPLNFELLGMIHLAFPKAKMLHIRRSPADTCLSIYQNYYGPGPNFTYNWENLLTYYISYLRFMELWRSILPEGALLEIDYEALVTDSEATIRSVIQFLGLPWEDACLHPDRNAGPVDTPSKWQVRQPFYRSSVEKWRNYAPWFPHLNAANALRPPNLVRT
jgi:tetratricopeptide (TPR) repeat protein